MASVRKSFVDRGFSANVADTAARARRESTGFMIPVLDTTKYCRWLGEGGHLWGILAIVARAERADGHSCSRHQRGRNHLGGHRRCTV